MSKPKKLRMGGGSAAAGGEADESSVRWLISYADFMMQLVCLFILLYSVSNVDAAKIKAIATAWREFIGAEPAKVQEKPEGRDVPGTIKPNEIADQVILDSGRVPDGRTLRVHKTRDGFRLLMIVNMFADGSSELTPAGLKALDVSAWLLKPYESQFLEIEVSGFGAAGEMDGDLPAIRTLSLDRARTAVAYLARADAPHALRPTMLVPAARGLSDPVADDTRPDERTKNMRVELRVSIRGVAEE